MNRYDVVYYRRRVPKHPLHYMLNPRRPWKPLDENEMTTEIPEDLYPDKPEDPTNTSYADFAETLFPQFNLNKDHNRKIPLIETINISETNEFRHRTQETLDQILNNNYQPEHFPLNANYFPEHETCIIPPQYRDIKPVLYQVVQRRQTSLLLQAVDILTSFPDRYDLQIIELDQTAYNHCTGKPGFMANKTTTGDLVYIYSVRPTTVALKNPRNILDYCNQKRPVTLAPDVTLFWRGSSFAFVTPTMENDVKLGVVIKIIRGDQLEHVVAISISLEHITEPLLVNSDICTFGFKELNEGDFIFATMRKHNSINQRYSEPAADLAYQDQLIKFSRNNITAITDGIATPFKVIKATPEVTEFARNRMRHFKQHIKEDRSLTKMGQLFRASASALATKDRLHEPRQWINTIISTPESKKPVTQFTFTTYARDKDYGFDRKRTLTIFSAEGSQVLIATIDKTITDNISNSLIITATCHGENHDTIKEIFQRYGTHENGTFSLDACIRLNPRTQGRGDPVFNIIATSRVLPLDFNSHLYTIAELLYANAYDSMDEAVNDLEHRTQNCKPTDNQKRRIPEWISIEGTRTPLTDEQRSAIAVSVIQNPPIMAILSGPGSGKTLTAAALTAFSNHEELIILITPSNISALELVLKLCSLDHYKHLTITRYVAETAQIANITDKHHCNLHEQIKTIRAKYGDRLTSKQNNSLIKYEESRNIVESHRANPIPLDQMTYSDANKITNAEKMLVYTEAAVTQILLEYQQPHIICLTAISALNTFAADGIFSSLRNSATKVIIDEASQIHELLLFNILENFPMAKTVLIGDPNQLPPHTTEPRSKYYVQCATTGILDTAIQSQSVKILKLNKIFICHSGITETASKIFYNNTLTSAAEDKMRDTLNSLMNHECSKLPIIFAQTNGAEARDETSYYNATELENSKNIVKALLNNDVSPADIMIMTLYTGAQRRLMDFCKQHYLHCRTVDSAQGCESNIIILLTTRTTSCDSENNFLDNPKRLNVAITRAKDGLIILGDRTTLEKTKYCSQILQEIKTYGTITNGEDLAKLITSRTGN